MTRESEREVFCRSSLHFCHFLLLLLVNDIKMLFFDELLKKKKRKIRMKSANFTTISFSLQNLLQPGSGKSMECSLVFEKTRARDGGASFSLEKC